VTSTETGTPGRVDRAAPDETQPGRPWSPNPMTLPGATAPNLALNEQLSHRPDPGHTLIHLGFGESRLPVHPALTQRLAAAATANSYGPVAGTSKVLTAAAGYFSRRRMSTTPDQVIVTPGSKAALFALIAALPGDVVLPQPSWVSYGAHALLTGRQVQRAPIPDSFGGVPDPEALEQALRQAHRNGQHPGILLLTAPDNPTGTTASPAVIQRICQVAGNAGLTIISDEIYRDIVHPPGSLLYGATTAEQWEALRSPDPAQVPHIARPLTRLRTALSALTDSRAPA
jgi:aspartate aminotransferase